MPSKASPVFLSYSHKDEEYIREVVRLLKTYNIEYWSDRTIAAGENWAEKIQTELDHASVFVLFISPNFLASSWALFEMGYALSRAKTSDAVVVPIVLRHVKLPKFLEQMNYLDAQSLSPVELSEKIRQAAVGMKGSPNTGPAADG